LLHTGFCSLPLSGYGAEYGQGWAQIRLRGRLTLFLSCSTQSVLASKPDWEFYIQDATQVCGCMSGCAVFSFFNVSD
jgi:hypothetical protein